MSFPRICLFQNSFRLFARKPPLLQIRSVFFPGIRLPVKGAGSFHNSSHVFSTNLSLSEFVPSFCQEAASFANSFGLFSRNPTSCKRSRLFSQFVPCLFHESVSFRIRSVFLPGSRLFCKFVRSFFQES